MAHSLSLIHYVYIAVTLIIIAAMLKKKEIVVPCAIGIMLMGLVHTRNPVAAVQIMSNALIASCAELFGIILVIALVTAMTNALQEAGVIQLIIQPVLKIFCSSSGAFFALGLCMSAASCLLWPSPAVVLVGALLLPAAVKCGLTPLSAACIMNLFGHGIALSGDFFIQGAPAITAGSAGLTVPQLNTALFPLWLVMSLTTAAVSFWCIRRQPRSQQSACCPPDLQKAPAPLSGRQKKRQFLSAVITLLCFVCVIAAMLFFHIIGSEATALISGTALLLTCILYFINAGPAVMLQKTTLCLIDGFVSAIRIFAPIVIIAAFFFLGNDRFAQSVLGPDAPGLLEDISFSLASRLPAGNFFAVLCVLAAGLITGMDGSGFSGLPIAGALAASLSAATGGNVAVLAAFGQIVTIWVGGGTLIPWAVAPVAAVCKVSPGELARKNFFPVAIGITATALTAVFLL